MTDLRIELLGAFRVVVGSREVPEQAWRRRKAAAVVKLLALAPTHRLPREQLMDILWPELDPRAAAANLRKCVHHARRAVDADQRERLIVSGRELLWLQPAVRVDAEEFLAAIAGARRSAAAADYARALQLYRDDLLPADRYEQWAIEKRDELRSELLAAIEELAAILEAQGDLDGAVRAVRRIVALEPLREDAQRRLMRLHALAGRRPEALRQYQRLRERLSAELGTEPGPATQRAYEEIRAHRESTPELDAVLWERVGDLRVLSGDTDGARHAFQAAVDAAPASADEVRLRRKLAAVLLMRHAPEEAEPHLAVAETLVTDPAERARLLCLRANQAWERGCLKLARQLAEQALARADSDGGAEDVACAREALAIVSHLSGDWRRGLELELERLAAGGDRGEQLGRISDIHQCIGQYHLYGDGLSDDVEDYARRTLALAIRAQAARAQAFAWCLLGESLLLRARWEEAAGCLQQSCELHDTLGTTTAGLPWQRLAELAVCRGAPREAAWFLGRAAAIATVSPMARHLWGRIHATAAFAALELGDPAGAARAVRAAAATAARYGDCPTCSALLNPIAAEALAALGDLDGACSYAQSAASVAGAFESSAWRAMAETAAGAVARGAEKPIDARLHFEAAAALYDRAGQPYWMRRARAQSAAVALGNGGGTRSQ